MGTFHLSHLLAHSSRGIIPLSGTVMMKAALVIISLTILSRSAVAAPTQHKRLARHEKTSQLDTGTADEGPAKIARRETARIAPVLTAEVDSLGVASTSA